RSPPLRPGAVLLRIHPRHRLVPAVRPGLRAHRRRARRRDPHRGPASLRDRVPELLPVRRSLRDGLGALRGHPGLLGAPVPAAARPHRVLTVAATRRLDRQSWALTIYI